MSNVIAGIGSVIVVGLIVRTLLDDSGESNPLDRAPSAPAYSPPERVAPVPHGRDIDPSAHSHSMLRVEVRDVYGTPVAGASITAFGLDLGSTDFDGRAAVEWPDPLPRRGQLRVRADGFVEAEAKFAMPHEARAVMVPAAEIQGTVLGGADMRPVSGAVVTTGRSTTLADADGTFFITDLSPGRHVLTARSPTGLGSTDPIQVGIAEVVDGVEIVLDAACTVRGVVDSAESLDIPLRARVGSASADVQEDGRFEIIGAKLDAGSLFLTSRALGSSFAQVGPIDIAPCSSDLNVELPSFSSALVEVVDDGGAPVPGAEMDVQYRSENGTGGIAPLRTDLDGKCKIEGVGPGSLRVDVKIPGAEIVEVDLPTSEPIVVRLEGVVHSLDGRLIDMDRAPVRSEKLVRLAPREGGRASYVTSDIDGAFSFSHVPSGAYDLSVHAGRNPVALAALEVEIGREGRRELEVELPTKSASLAGRVVDERGDPVDHAIVDIRTHSGGEPGWITNPGNHFIVAEPDGSFELQGLERGIDVVLTAFAEETGQSFPTIASPGIDVEICVVPVGKVEVRSAARQSAQRCKIRVVRDDKPLFHVSVAGPLTTIDGIPVGETTLELTCGGARDSAALDVDAGESAFVQFD